MRQGLFIDANIILDFLLKRDPFAIAAFNLFKLLKHKSIIGYSSADIFTSLYYLIRKQSSHDKAITILSELEQLIKVLPVTEKDIKFGLKTTLFRDFEDAVQYSVAKEHNLSYIITRDKKDYKNSDIPVVDAEEYVVSFSKK